MSITTVDGHYAQMDILYIPLARKPLPPVIEGQHVQNELDKQLQYYREVELKHIFKEARKLREAATDVSDVLGEVENFMAQLKNLAIEVRAIIIVLLLSQDNHFGECMEGAFIFILLSVCVCVCVYKMLI